MKHAFLAIIPLLAVLALAACAQTSTPDPDTQPEEVPIDGGNTTHIDANAPKEIESGEIADFYAHFYLVGEWGKDDGDREYIFEVKPDENGVLIASESGSGAQMTADEALLAALQRVIDENELAKNNGIYDVTAGLPPEFQACSVDVNYVSGEYLTFTINNEPESPWAQGFYLAFSDWFAAKGDDRFVPPRETGHVTRLRFDWKKDGKHYSYGDIKVPEEMAIDGQTLVLNKDIYSYGTEKTEVDLFCAFPEDYFDRISEIFASHDLRSFSRYSVLYGQGRENFDPWPDKGDLEIYLEYEGGHRENIMVSEPSDIALLQPLLDDLLGYLDGLFEE